MSVKTNKFVLWFSFLMSVIVLLMVLLGIPAFHAVFIVIISLIFSVLDLDKPSIELSVDETKELIGLLSTPYFDFSPDEVEDLVKLRDKLKIKVGG